MAIPDYEACMLPMLHLLKDGEARSLKELTQRVADQFGLTDDERHDMQPSGQQSYIANRVGWAKFYMKAAGLVESPLRGRVRITDAGRGLLDENPSSLDCKDLMKYPSFAEFWRQKRKSKAGTIGESTAIDSAQDQTPDEAIESAYQDIRDALADELLERIMESSPLFFERLVIDLLVAMGYGGGIADAAQHLGKPRDGGIDGIINEDKLALDVICVQAKRWKETVGRPAVQAFAGSMEAHRAKKGVMITPSAFSKDAYDFVDRIERKIILIEGRQLAQLMIDHDIGVSTFRTYAIKKIDSDYFAEGDLLT